ncbi:MAG: HEAT repeat domain-containing protein [Isosphaeraceae bacterium]
MMKSTIGDDPMKPRSSGENGGRTRRGVRLAITLGVCCTAIWWAWRAVWENSHPGVATARGLESGDSAQRLAAIRALSALGTDGSASAMRPLLPLLADQVPAVRSAAAQSLGIVALYAVKSGTETETVRAVAQGLFGALKDPDASVRLEAAGALVALADAASGSSRGTGGRGKAKAAKSSGASPTVIDQKAVVAALLELLGDPDVEVRRAALLGIGKIASRSPGNPPQALFAAMEDESPIIREAAVSALVRFPTGLDALMPALFRHLDHDEPLVRAACTTGLGRIGPSALTPAVIPLLIAGLGSRERDVRLHSVTLIGRMSPDPRLAVPALIAVLREPYESDQQRVAGQMMTILYAGPAQEAAAALGRIAPGTPAAGQAIRALTEVVRSGPSRRRAAAAKALAQFGPAAAEAVTALIAFLQEAEASQQMTEDRASAARALGRIAPGTSTAEKAVAALSAVLKSHSAPARQAAVEAIRSFGPAAAGTPPVIPTLRELNENDPVPHIRQAAASALEALKAGPQ